MTRARLPQIKSPRSLRGLLKEEFYLCADRYMTSGHPIRLTRIMTDIVLRLVCMGDMLLL